MAVESYGETYATLLGAKARAELFGGQQFMKYRLGEKDFFLQHLHGVPASDLYQRIDAMQFVTHYINTYFGWNVHKRMLLEWEHAFKPMRTVLKTAGLNDTEAFAAAYSMLVGENIGELFQIAGLPVNAAKVQAGLNALVPFLMLPRCQM